MAIKQREKKIFMIFFGDIWIYLSIHIFMHKMTNCKSFFNCITIKSKVSRGHTHPISIPNLNTSHSSIAVWWANARHTKLGKKF